MLTVHRHGGTRARRVTPPRFDGSAHRAGQRAGSRARGRDGGRRPAPFPSTDSAAFRNAMADLWLAVTTGHPDAALPGFFPLAACLWGSRTRPSVLTWASMRLARTR